jgi:hypothetical protein
MLPTCALCAPQNPQCTSPARGMLQGCGPAGKHSYRARLDRSCGGFIRVLATALVLVFAAAIALFVIYGVLAYRQGKGLPRLLDDELETKASAVSSVHRKADLLQAVINGTQPVGGAFISSAFQPEPPTLVTHSQVRAGVSLQETSCHTSHRHSYHPLQLCASARAVAHF